MVCKRRCPSMTMAQFNSRRIHKGNNTAAYMEATYDEEKYKKLRGVSRTRDAMGPEKKRLGDQGREDEEQATQKRTKRDAAKVKKAASKMALASLLKDLKVILDPAILKQKPPKGKDINLQLEWHRGYDDQVPMKSHLKKKASKLKALIAAVNRHNNNGAEVLNFTKEMEAASKDLEEEEEDEEELYQN